MRGLIVGLGSIGRRHLANLRDLEPDGFVAIWHQHSRPSDGAFASVQADCLTYSLDDALATRPDFAVISNPASVHVATALDLAQHGVHLLVEKPLSDRLEGVDRLLDECHSQAVTLLVGYNYRFHRPLQLMRQALDEGRIGRIQSVRAEVGQYLPDWRPESDYRQSTTARRELGGGVLLELSHEIDYVRWLVGEVREVTARMGQVSKLEIDVEDCAEILLDFDNGAIGSIHLDMIQRAPTRNCRLIGSEGTLAWDGTTNRLAWYSATTGSWEDLCPPAQIDRNAMYAAEMRHFLECVRGTAQPTITGADGRRVLRIALAARQSAVERRSIAV